MRGIFSAFALVVTILVTTPTGVVFAGDRSDCFEGFGGGDWKTATSACGRLLKSSRIEQVDRARILTMRGHWYLAAGDGDKAIADYRAAQRINPTKETARAIAQAYSENGEFAKALAEINEYLGYASTDVDGYHLRATLHAKLRMFDNAIEDINHKIRLGVRTDVEYMLRASFWFEKGDYPHAVADYDEAIRLSPKNQSAYEFRARVKHVMGDLKGALADYQKAFTINPSDAKALGIDRHIERLKKDIASNFRVQQSVAKFDQRQTSSSDLRPIKTAERRIALVIGNADYAHASALKNPNSDAKLLAASLKRLGFASVRLRFNLKRDQLLDELRSFASQAAGADWAVVYFAGHGIEIGGVNYLIPVDAKLRSDRDIVFEAIALDQVLASIEGAKKLRIAILDACRDNPFVRKMNRSMGASRSIGRGLAAVETQRATLVAYAARHGQVALDGDATNSPYVSALVKALETPGLEISLLFRKVRDDVLVATDNAQEPFTYGSLPSTPYYFRTHQPQSLLIQMKRRWFPRAEFARALAIENVRNLLG